MAENESSAAGAISLPIDAIVPRTRWSQLTDAPLAGLALAREAGLVLAWDAAHNISLIDLGGKRVRTSRAPVPLARVAISDDGSQIVAASQDGDIWWLHPTLEPRLQQGHQRHLIGIALSPRGEFLAASLNDSHTHLYDCFGRRVINLMTHRPLKHLAFLVGQSCLVGAAEYGLVGCYDLDGEPNWQDQLWSSAGHLSVSGEGYGILVSCYSHGIQRYGLDGTNEGAYHLGGGVSRAAIDYDGRLFAAATLESELLVVNAAGHVLWRDTLAKPVTELAMDAAGQFIVYGVETGEITLLEFAPTKWTASPAQASPLDQTKQSLAAASPVPAAEDKKLREPTWRVVGFDDESQAETAVLALVPNPLRVVAFSNRKRIEVYSETGERLHQSELLAGVGRYLDTDVNVIIAGTDREMVRYDVAANTSQKLPDRLTGLSHLRLDSESGEIVILEDREYLSRYDYSGRRRWVHHIDSPVESLALGPDRFTGVTTEDGRLIVFDSDKRAAGEYRTASKEILQLVRLGSRWITLAGKSQRVRSHRLDGEVEWEVGLPTEAWRLYRLASQVVARAVNGRSYCLDARGNVLLDTSDLPPESLLFVDSAGAAASLYWNTGNLMVTDLIGRVQWRHLSAATLGPVAAGAAGVACALGRDLTFFQG